MKKNQEKFVNILVLSLLKPLLRQIYLLCQQDAFYKVKSEDEIIAISNIDEDENPQLDITYNYFMYLVPLANIFI